MKRIFQYIVILLLFSLPIPAVGQTECPEYKFVKIADTDTPVPDGNGGTFEGLSLNDPAVDGIRVAFYGEGGGAEGIFVSDGETLNSVAAVGDPLTGNDTIESIVEDFAFSSGVFNVIINTPSTGNHGIYATDGGGLSKIVEFGESAPGGGTFSTLRFVSRQTANLAFWANIFEIGMPARSNGVFTRIAGVNELVADSTTVIPGSAPTTFSGFSDPDISGQNVAFHGGRGAHTGVYALIDGILTKVADVTDTVPGGVKSFTTFSVPVISRRQVAFRGAGDGSGIFVGDGGPLTVIAKTGDPATGGSTFSGFGPNVAADRGEVAFKGSGSGFIGLFVSGQFGLCRVIDFNDTLEGKDISDLFIGRDSYTTGKLAFRALFADGSRGIYLAKASASYASGAIFLLLGE